MALWDKVAMAEVALMAAVAAAVDITVAAAET
jgi:hypothetical protein